MSCPTTVAFGEFSATEKVWGLMLGGVFGAAVIDAVVVVVEFTV